MLPIACTKVSRKAIHGGVKEKKEEGIEATKMRKFEKGRASDTVCIAERVLKLILRILKGIGQQVAEESLVILFGIFPKLRYFVNSLFIFVVIIIDK